MAAETAVSRTIPQGGPFTYRDYKHWDLASGERYEFIYGEAYAMSAPSGWYQLIQEELFRQFANYLVGKSCNVYPPPYDVRLFYEADESDTTVVQPDITVICDPEKQAEEGDRILWRKSYLPQIRPAR